MKISGNSWQNLIIIRISLHARNRVCFSSFIEVVSSAFVHRRLIYYAKSGFNSIHANNIHSQNSNTFNLFIM